MPVVLGDEATFSMRIEPAPHVEAPIVFAGYGLQVPEAKHDDLAGLDLKGKVVAAADGRPLVDSGSAARALPEHALVVSEAGRRDRRHLDPEPEGPGHPVGAIEARALPAVDGDRRSRARRDGRAAAGGDGQRRDGGEILRRAADTRSRSCSNCRMPVRCCRASRFRRRFARRSPSTPSRSTPTTSSASCRAPIRC